jgi:hypothetical protein
MALLWRTFVPKPAIWLATSVEGTSFALARDRASAQQSRAVVAAANSREESPSALQLT